MDLGILAHQVYAFQLIFLPLQGYEALPKFHCFLLSIPTLNNKQNSQQTLTKLSCEIKNINSEKVLGNERVGKDHVPF